MTFHGVVFKPNEIHSVNGVINHKGIIRVDAPQTGKKSQISAITSVSRTSNVEGIVKRDTTSNSVYSTSNIQGDKVSELQIEVPSKSSIDNNTNITEPIAKPAKRGRRSTKSDKSNGGGTLDG